MLIGRGANFAWSLTSAGGDIIDTYAETLCGGSKTRYRYKGKCRKMTTLKAGALTQGTVTRNVTVRRTVHGPVIGYARDARTHKLVALTKKRSTAGRDVLDQRFFRRLTFGTIGSAKDFIDAAATTPQTFNSFYVSKSEIAEITTGRLPVRPKNVNPDLPVDGRGRFEWRGYLSAKGHPHVTNPPSGLIVNWNNKPARNFPAGDDRWSEGSIMRSELLTGELARTAKHTPATVTAAMNAAATEDVREVQLWPVLKAVLAKAPSPSARATSMAAQLQNWYEKGGSRLDRDGDGKIDSAGVVSLDNAWAGMARAAMCGRLGTSGCDALETRMSVFDQPPGGQYAGWHQYMDKDLRTLLGRKVKGKYGLRYCGKGSVKACAKSLWAAIDAAGAKVSAAQGDDPSTWREASEVTRFAPLPLTTIRYTNRPSGIQQVIQFGAAR
jgi:acyl-homoserine lactone acylase PvdQ